MLIHESILFWFQIWRENEDLFLREANLRSMSWIAA